jgi:hypothetical protein
VHDVWHATLGYMMLLTADSNFRGGNMAQDK